MTSILKRTAAILGAAVVLAIAVAAGQDRKPGPAAEHASVGVFNSVESRTTVVSCRSHGATVQKGDVLCELDPSELRDRLSIQEIAIRSAQADLHGARIAREVAAMEATEYEGGLFVQELATREGDIKLAEASLASREDALDWTRRMYEKGYVSLAAKVTEELTLKKAVFALERAEQNLKSPDQDHQGKDHQRVDRCGRNGPWARASEGGRAPAGAVRTQATGRSGPPLQGRRTRERAYPSCFPDRAGCGRPGRAIALPDRSRG
jgi:hypothetical protein